MDPFKTLIIGTPPSRTFTGDATGLLTAANNLSDVADAATAAENIGVGATDSPTHFNLTLTGNLTASGTGTFGSGGNTVTLSAGAVTATGTGNNTLGGNLLIGSGAWPATNIGRSASRVFISDSSGGGYFGIGDNQAGVGTGRGGTLYLYARGTTATEDIAGASLVSKRANATSGNFESSLEIGVSTAGTSNPVTQITVTPTGATFAGSVAAASIFSNGCTTATTNLPSSAGINSINNGVTVAFNFGVPTLTSAQNLGNFFNGNGTVGSITVNGSATTYNTSSDYRLKNITGPLESSGAFIDALMPKVGTWKIDGGKFVGFLAHEFAEVSPGSVSGEKDAVGQGGKPVYQTMQASTPEVIANIVAELQALRRRVLELEAR